jgi:serine/threonine protein kinase
VQGSPSSLAEGQAIGEYTLGKELGRGSMGVVFEAWHAELRRKVALKIMLPRALALEGVVERFMRGAQLASALSHPNAVVIYGVGLYQPAPDIQGLPYMVMEHLDGEDLFAFISRHQRVPLDVALDIIQQSLEVIADAHRRGIIHRDLKPENLFLTRDRDGRRLVKVLDFGLAKAVTEGWGSSPSASPPPA